MKFILLITTLIKQKMVKIAEYALWVLKMGENIQMVQNLYYMLYCDKIYLDKSYGTY